MVTNKKKRKLLTPCAKPADAEWTGIVDQFSADGEATTRFTLCGHKESFFGEVPRVVVSLPLVFSTRGESPTGDLLLVAGTLRLSPNVLTVFPASGLESTLTRCGWATRDARDAARAALATRLRAIGVPPTQLVRARDGEAWGLLHLTGEDLPARAAAALMSRPEYAILPDLPAAAAVLTATECSLPAFAELADRRCVALLGGLIARDPVAMASGELVRRGLGSAGDAADAVARLHSVCSVGFEPVCVTRAGLARLAALGAASARACEPLLAAIGARPPPPFLNGLPAIRRDAIAAVAALEAVRGDGGARMAFQFTRAAGVAAIARALHCAPAVAAAHWDRIQSSGAVVSLAPPLFTTPDRAQSLGAWAHHLAGLPLGGAGFPLPARPDPRPHASAHLAPEQCTALEALWELAVSPLAGPAGTGKSTLVREFMLQLLRAGVPPAAFWLTGYMHAHVEQLRTLFGSAAAEAGLTELDPLITTADAIPFNMASRFSPFRTRVARVRVVFVEESGLIGVGACVALMTAVRPLIAAGARVVFCGDPYQLAPVAGGTPFRDLIAAANEPRLRLSVNHRAQNEVLAALAAALQPDAPRAPTAAEIRGILEQQSSAAAWYGCNAGAAAYVPERAGWGLGDTWPECLHRALSQCDPERKHPSSICILAFLNCTVRLANRVAAGYYSARDPPFVGMRTRCAMPRSGFHRGAFYIVAALLNRRVALVPERGGEERSVKLDRFWAHFEQASAVTIHGSQGQEWPIVIVLLPGMQAAENAEMVYVAATRARSRCIFIVGDNALSTALARRPS